MKAIRLIITATCQTQHHIKLIHSIVLFPLARYTVQISKLHYNSNENLSKKQKIISKKSS